MTPRKENNISYSNDSAGRRVEVSRSGSAFGALSGVTDAYGYDERSQVVSSRRTLGGDEVRGFDYDYAYDPIGNRLAASYYDEQGEEAYSDYEANALNQYVSRTVPGNVQVRGEADAGATITVNGNPTWRNGEYFYGGDYADNSAAPVFREVEIAAVIPASSPDGYDEIDAVTGCLFVAKSPEQFTYDADGNMTCDGRFSYVWNAENRLVRAQELYAPTNRNPYTVTYAYDHRGRMVRKVISRGGAETRRIEYIWDNWNIIRETATNYSTNQLINFSTDYVWGLDLDGTLQGAGGVGGLLAVIRTNSSTPQLYFPTYDANGNVSEYISTNGTIVAHYDYSPFGEILVQSGDLADTFTHRFSTKLWCPVTGLYEYQMRKYRPEIGRWMSRDPIGEDGGANLYVMCRNNPLTTFDTDGRYEWTEESAREKLQDTVREFRRYGWNFAADALAHFVSGARNNVDLSHYSGDISGNSGWRQSFLDNVSSKLSLGEENKKIGDVEHEANFHRDLSVEDFNRQTLFSQQFAYRFQRYNSGNLFYALYGSRYSYVGNASKTKENIDGDCYIKLDLNLSLASWDALTYPERFWRNLSKQYSAATYLEDLRRSQSGEDYFMPYVYLLWNESGQWVQCTEKYRGGTRTRSWRQR